MGLPKYFLEEVACQTSMPGPRTTRVDIILVWVQIPSLPLILWSKDVFAKIGTPLVHIMKLIYLFEILDTSGWAQSW